MNPGLVTALLFLCLFVLLATGLPVVFVLGAISVIFAAFLWGPDALGVLATSASRLMSEFPLLAIPLFITMASILERSGVADDMYAAMHSWFGRVRGGLAMGTVLICTVIAAMSGVSAAGTVAMGVIALPAMLKRGYDKSMVIGSIQAGGALGALIPPSVMMVVWSLWAGESVGEMFLGGIIPGIILSGLFVTYIGIRCYFQPHLGPPVPVEEREDWGRKVIRLRSVILPVLLIIGVLGSIFGGIATPTEAAAIGVLGTLISAAIYRRLNWKNLTQALFNSLRLSSMIMWIMIAGLAFASVYNALGARQFVLTTFENIGINPWVVIISMQGIYFIMGCLMGATEIMMLTIPVFVPVIKALGFSSLWFGVVFIINMEMAFLTPPVGANLFYMRGIVPEGIDMLDIYRSVIPFVILQGVGLVIVMIFPQTILWLPSLIMGK